MNAKRGPNDVHGGLDPYSLLSSNGVDALSFALAGIDRGGDTRGRPVRRSICPEPICGGVPGDARHGSVVLCDLRLLRALDRRVGGRGRPYQHKVSVGHSPCAESPARRMAASIRGCAAMGGSLLVCRSLDLYFAAYGRLDRVATPAPERRVQRAGVLAWTTKGTRDQRARFQTRHASGVVLRWSS